jgi:pyruvate/2-oxoglutarate/acetoin dehydrogenase E1 component
VISRVAISGFNILKGAPQKIAAPECPIPYAKNLENAMVPTPEAIMYTVEKMLD